MKFESLSGWGRLFFPRFSCCELTWDRLFSERLAGRLGKYVIPRDYGWLELGLVCSEQTGLGLWFWFQIGFTV